MKKVKGFLHSAAVFVVMSLLLICTTPLRSDETSFAPLMIDDMDDSA